MSANAPVFAPSLGAGQVPRRTHLHAAALLVVASLVCSALAINVALGASNAPVLSGFVRVDATSRLFLAVINPLFFGVCVYVRNRVSTTIALRKGMRRFAWFALAFLAAANVVVVSNHLLLLWLALEATSLAAAPLIVRGSARASHLASFRYLLFSCVALGLVLLGISCLAASMQADGIRPTFFVDQLPALLTAPPNAFRKLGLVLILLGLGTKLGLAPMYSWLPETYDEAPPAVAALLGAVQFNCTLVMLLRVVQVYRTGSEGVMSGLLVGMGVASMVVATFNIIATHNLRRLLSYASINHAGVIAIGLAIGKGAAYGLLLYVISNAFIKTILFLTAGKIEAHYRTKDTTQIAGLIKDLPYSGVFLMVGTFALLGFPPFGSFLGELVILSALVSSGRMLSFAALCVLISMSFVATGRTIFPMIWGEPAQRATWPRQTLVSALPKIAFLLALVALGLYVPAAVEGLIRQVASTLEGS